MQFVTLVLTAVIGISSAQLLTANSRALFGGSDAFSGSVNTLSGGGTGPAGGGVAVGNPHSAIQVAYRSRVYGPGLNNPTARSYNVFMMNRALAILDSTPDALVRVETNGQITVTDKFGREAEVFDQFGRDLTESFDD